MNLESGLIAVKYKLIIDESKEENIIITAHKKTDLILEIEKLINSSLFKLNGYKEDEIYPLELTDIYCFYTADTKIIAKTKNDEYLVKERIYQLEENSKELFVKINQGCLINIKKIHCFESNIGGSIKVVMKNGFSDYISRRELKNVKRRLGL